MIHSDLFQDNYENFLLNSEIDERNEQLASVDNYDLSLNLWKERSIYAGVVQIGVKLKKQFQANETLSIDFYGDSVSKVETFFQQPSQDQKGKEISLDYSSFIYEKRKVKIKSNLFESTQGQNGIFIRIEFIGNYSRNQFGLNISESNDNTYIYTQGEPVSQHKFFPCIDQINFRSTFSLKVEHPSHWRVISNGKLLSQEPVLSTKDRLFTVFKTIQEFPVYLFALCAGNFQVFENKIKRSVSNSIDNQPTTSQEDEDYIGIDIYCRKEVESLMAEQIDIFQKLTEFGIRYMEDYTKLPYFMDKYDQVFCDDYAHYGMENPGCVTMEERRYIFDEEREPLKISQRADVTLHEISHLWFGDKLSIVWWNDLFLKEGMATFFGYKMTKEFFKEGDLHLYFELNKVSIIMDEIDQSKVFSVSHQRGECLNYQKKEYHNNVSYQKAASVFEMMEQKLLGEQGFRSLIIEIIANSQNNQIDAQQFLTLIGNDTIVKKYIQNKGVSYFYKGKFIDTYDLHLEDKEYEQLNLKYYRLGPNKQQIQQISFIDSKKQIEQTVVLIDSCDGHIVFQRLSHEELQIITNLEVMPIFTQSLRISVWKAIILEGILFSQGIQFSDNNQNLSSLFPSFFFDNILLESNLVVLQFTLRQVLTQFPPFSEEYEDRLFELYDEEKDSLRKKIILKSMIRNMNSQNGLSSLLHLYCQQSFKIKEKYLNLLSSKLKEKPTELQILLEKNKKISGQTKK